MIVPDINLLLARSWLGQPQVSVLHPGDRHAEILFGLLGSLGTAGNLTTDAHLAALAIEYQAELHTTEADFKRFPGLRWSNPLA
jgi:predicted nucleic acid-binding protein